MLLLFALQWFPEAFNGIIAFWHEEFWGMWARMWKFVQDCWHLLPVHNVQRGSTEHLTGVGHRNPSHRSSLWCSEVSLEPSHALLLFYSLACVQRKQALPKAQHLGKTNNAVHWLLVRKAWETLLTFIYSDMFIKGYHSLHLRMEDLRHYPLHWVLPYICQLCPDSRAVPDTKWDPGEMETKLSKISIMQTEKKKKHLEINYCKTFNIWISLVFLDFFSLDS